MYVSPILMSEIVTSTPKYMRYVLGNFTPAEMVTDGNFLIYSVEMGLLTIGVLENLCMIVAVMSTSALHLNLRILICNCCIGFILMAAGRAMIAIPLCIAHLRDVDISSHAWCFVANAVHHSSADSVCLSFVFIMLERTAGTIWSKDYEKIKIHIFPCVFAFLQWLIPMSMILGNYLDRANRMHYFLEYPHLPCQVEYLTPSMFIITIFIILIGFIASVVGMTVVYKKNISKYNAREIWFTNSNLSERYQISENIRSTHLLFPLLLLMLVFSILSVAVLVYGGYWVGVMTKKPTRFEEVVKWFGRGGEAAQLFDIITAIYTISFPICAFKCHPNLFRRLRRVIGWNSYATKCEWKQNWKNAEGVKRKLDAGPSGVQYFYFCKGERTENCGVWVDEENKAIENYDSNDRLTGDVFVIEKMGIPVLGVYAKFPEEKEDKRLIIE
ncbi:Protein CBG13358 [Caenorhabditis briggsae]|uniref:Protein CBG13358 n=1 Tax=Caenorhabditis briggsae TaxID=6238 RepID=A8XHY6_CAEBR|nr:Protein CBG13358 [Caenorhabditis briggsae]CAP32252.1 Protein CBG13358 [Caenorhabditis briggsae]